MGFSTDAIHAGQEPDPTTGAVNVPIYQTSTYVQEGINKHKGFEYARTQNPTRMAFEKNIAVLEKGFAAHAFASGMAAITTTMLLLKAGDHILCTDNVYGGTYRVFTQVFSKLGLDFSWVDTSSQQNIHDALRPNTRMVYIETPTNPMLALTDLRKTAELCASRDLLMAVDNTFMSPYFQNPIPHGAHLVIHSTTKYLNGHSDGVGGVVVSANQELATRIGFLQNAAGGILAPFDSFLVLRGIKTLPLRMQKHNENAMNIAHWLTRSKKVHRVFYPGLANHPQHELARKQATGFGGMISFDVGNLENARKVVENVRIFSFAESLGGVESLIGHPATMTHASVPVEKRNQMGLTDGVIRLSVGIEDIEDLIADLDHALSKL